MPCDSWDRVTIGFRAILELLYINIEKKIKPDLIQQKQYHQQKTSIPLIALRNNKRTTLATLDFNPLEKEVNNK